MCGILCILTQHGEPPGSPPPLHAPPQASRAWDSALLRRGPDSRGCTQVGRAGKRVGCCALPGSVPVRRRSRETAVHAVLQR